MQLRVCFFPDRELLPVSAITCWITMTIVGVVYVKMEP